MGIGYTIGGMMLFPGNRIGRQMTINGARGFHPRIKDRFDLTVECIRRHYLNVDSPLSATLARYASALRTRNVEHSRSASSKRATSGFRPGAQFIGLANRRIKLPGGSGCAEWKAVPTNTQNSWADR
jgi:hypothetical protein